MYLCSYIYIYARCFIIYLLNLRDNVFVFSGIAKVVILGVNLILGENFDTKLNLCMDTY